MSDTALLTEHFDFYMTYLLEEKHTSANTLQAYRRDIVKFLDFVSANGIESFEAATDADINDFKNHLIDSGLSTSSICRTLSAVRTMYKYLMSQNIATHNPAKDVHNDHLEKKEPMVLTSKEIEALLAAPDTSTIKGMRDKAMLELLYATGMKVSELVSLNVDDLNLSIPLIRVSAGEKERFIPLYRVDRKSVV